jgi:Ubiquitin-like domain
MSEIISIITSDTVKVNVSNSSNDVLSFEKKFDKRQTISDLKVSHANFYCCFLLIIDLYLISVKA